MTPETPSEAARDLLHRVSLALYATRDLRVLVDAQERWLYSIQKDMTQFILERDYSLFKSLEDLDH